MKIQIHTSYRWTWFSSVPGARRWWRKWFVCVDGTFPVSRSSRIKKRVHFHKLQQNETRWGFFPSRKAEFRAHYEPRRSWSPGLRALLGPAAVLRDVWVWTYNHRVSSSKTLQLPGLLFFSRSVNIWLIECERGSEWRCENTRAGKGGL